MGFNFDHMKLRLSFLMLSCFLIYSNSIQAQDDKFKSAFLYQFGRIMEFPNQGSDFTIAIWGDSEITPLIEKIAEIKQIGDKKIVVKEISQNDQLAGCQIVFIPTQYFPSLETIKNLTINKGVLIVSEKDGSSKSGAGISFIKVNDKLLFEINKKNIEAGGLKSTLSLERIAHKVY